MSKEFSQSIQRLKQTILTDLCMKLKITDELLLAYIKYQDQVFF